jgi:uncharacterized RDD family membrane protein YckC
MTNLAPERRRLFHLHSAGRAAQLAGLPLAALWQRFMGYLVDLVVAIILWAPMEYLWRRYIGHQTSIVMKWDFHEAGNIVVMLLYWGLATYFTNGRTVGKWAVRSRVVSLTGERLGLWQSFERALGYGAAVLEGGIGILQIFWDTNRMCAQDRLAETVVLDLRRRTQPPLIPREDLIQPEPAEDLR